MRNRLSRLYEALETSDLTMEVLSPRIYSMRHREEQLMAAQEDLSRQLEKRRVDLPSTEEIKEYVADFREFLQQGTFPERKALIRNFVQEIEVVGDQATLTYTIPMPSDGATEEETSVRYFANSGLPNGTVLRTPSPRPSWAAQIPFALYRLNRWHDPEMFSGYSDSLAGFSDFDC